MATQGESKDFSSDADDRTSGPIERSLRDAMDSDPRLASGLGGVQPDNVLDFIQMTGLTTGAHRDEWDPPAPERPDDPVSFFEYGVHDVDGSKDPEPVSDIELDLDAFRAPEVAQSETLEELKQIIADLSPQAEVDSKRPTDANDVMERTVTEELLPSKRPESPSVDESLSVEEPIETLPTTPPEQGTPLDAADARETKRTGTDDLRAARDLLAELTIANEAAARTERHMIAPVEPDPAHPEPRRKDDGRTDEAPISDTSSAEAVTSEVESFDEPTPLVHGLPRRRSRAGFGQWMVRSLFVVGIAASAYGTWWLYSQQVRTPTSAFASADRLLAAGKNEQAARAFVAFSEQHPSHPARADALFNAAAALHATPAHPEAESTERYEQAIALLQQFTTDYPGHEKVARAHTMTGVLFYRLGKYDAAINILGDPDLRLRDPAAYLTALRTLGRSYAEMSQIENARTAFMRAAALPENLAPDQDYVELADLYQRIAERSGDPLQRTLYMEKAIEQWNLALQVPGLLRNRKEDIKLLRDVAASKLRQSGEAASVGVAEPGASTDVRFRTINRGSEQGDPGARNSDLGESDNR